MTANGVQADLRLLGWEEDFRADNIGRSGHLLFPDGLDVFAIRDVSAPWRSSCYIIPFPQIGDDDAGDDIDEVAEATVDSESNGLEVEMEEEENNEVTEVRLEEDEDDQEKEEVSDPLYRTAQLDAEAARNGIWKIPFNIAPEFITIKGIVCVKRVF